LGILTNKKVEKWNYFFPFFNLSNFSIFQYLAAGAASSLSSRILIFN